MKKNIHKGVEKKKFVQEMFDDISKEYDFLNHFLSLGIDIYWRKKFLKLLPINNNTLILDVATGTGDVGFEIRKKYDAPLIGLDYSYNMLKKGQDKSKKLNTSRFTFIQGDAESLPIDDNSIDIITIAYGIRNLSNFKNALSEFNRVLKPGGTLGILEFSQSKSKIFSACFNIYFHKILPKIGAWISGSNAYNYLPESVSEFMTRNELINLMTSAGFKNCYIKDLTFGITSIFTGKK